MCEFCRNSSINKSQRIAATILSIAILVVVLFSSFYLAAEENHDCTGEDCPICVCIQQYENNIRQMVNEEITNVLANLLVMFFLLPIYIRAIFVFKPTLVTQKVRLNN